MTTRALPFSSRTVSPRAWEYLRPSSKMWPIVDAAGQAEGAGAVGGGVALADLGGLDSAVGGEARPMTRSRTCFLSVLAPVTQLVPSTIRGSTR